MPLFESQNQTPRLIKKVGKREIANAEQLGNMLRGGQTLVRPFPLALHVPHLATQLCKLMSTYGKLVASKYLKKVPNHYPPPCAVAVFNRCISRFCYQ